jgi:hypothetical protein
VEQWYVEKNEFLLFPARAGAVGSGLDDHIPIDFCSVQSSNCREASRPNMTASMTGEPGDRGHVRDRVRRQPEVIVIMLAELVTSMS